MSISGTTTLQLNGNMEVYTPPPGPPDTFHAFPHLPTELQLQIWAYAASAWIEEFFERSQTWIVPSALKTLRPVLCHIRGDPRRGREWPNLLWTCAGARGVLYDFLLRRAGDGDGNGGKVLNGGMRKRPEVEIMLFLRRCLVRPGLVMEAKSLGWRIHDFRVEGLSKRVHGEQERMQILQQELDDVRRKITIFPKPLNSGYVRLPLFNGTKGCASVVMDGKRRWVSLYPSLPTEEDEEFRVWREGVMMG